MPRIIQTLHSILPVEGVYIARAKLQQGQRAQTLIDEAKRSARRLIKDAQVSADDAYQQALRDGYRDGVIAAADAIADHFFAEQRLASDLQKKLMQQVRTALQLALDHPELILVLLDEWLKNQITSADIPLKLFLPCQIYHAHEQVMACLEAAWCARVQVEYHDDERFILSSGDQIAEFDPTSFLGQIEEKAKPHCAELFPAYSALSKETLDKINGIFQHRFTNGQA